jgi:hypothetical protein
LVKDALIGVAHLLKQVDLSDLRILSNENVGIIMMRLMKPLERAAV